MEDLTVASPTGYANFTIPAHTSAEFFDADGNLIAHFDQPRPYDKVDNSGYHSSKFADAVYPMTVKFTEFEPPAPVEHQDGAF